jgi:hypothetical protein
MEQAQQAGPRVPLMGARKHEARPRPSADADLVLHAWMVLDHGPGCERGTWGWSSPFAMGRSGVQPLHLATDEPGWRRSIARWLSTPLLVPTDGQRHMTLWGTSRRS